ncbi:MAG: ABC transporter permease [Leptolyngbya foveolarum]|uniref:ABC transporter permease n=1 Tax=Leptolyngbya foveolarum TaxID=47253 RepID=A0A2W4U7Z7_9CYAN|nr:MAG: ABC transporter permease [Leptolyngbya foveolarum]
MLYAAKDLAKKIMNKGMWRRRGLWAGLLAMPQVGLLLVLLVYPMGVLLLQSIGTEGERSLGNYLSILRSERYLQAFSNTALIAITSTLLALIICVPAAIYIERGRGHGRKVIAVLLTIPLSLPGIVVGFFIILNFGLTGVVPQAIEAVTGDRHFTFAYTFWGMLLGYLYFQIPRVVLVVRGAAAGISEDAVEVARTLGAPTWRIYSDVILPTLRPALVSAASLSLATAFGAYGTAATLSRGYRVVPLEIAAAFTERFRPELAASLSLLLAVVTTTLLIGMGQLTSHSAQNSPSRS